MALNIIAAGLTVVLGVAWFQQGGQTPPVNDAVRLAPLWPGATDSLGAILGGGLLAHNILVYLALVLVAAVWWLVYRTRFGLRLRAVGENPHMVEAAGVSVRRLRYIALTANGVLCGLAGAYLVLAQNASFGPNMTAGRGYMALAALIFGQWRPVPALGGVPALRLPRHGRGAAAGVKLPQRGRDTGAGDPGPAIPPHRAAARRIHRAQTSPRRPSGALREGTLRTMPATLAPHTLDRLLEAARTAQRRAHAPVLALPRRRRGAGRVGARARRLQRRERRLSHGNLRGDERDRRHGRGRRQAITAVVVVATARRRSPRAADAASASPNSPRPARP
jgi:hypothetical protein